MSFPTDLQLKLPLEVPLWMDLADTKQPPMDTRPNESDADSGITGEREPSPRHAQCRWGLLTPGTVRRRVHGEG